MNNENSDKIYLKKKKTQQIYLKIHDIYNWTLRLRIKLNLRELYTKNLNKKKVTSHPDT